MCLAPKHIINRFYQPTDHLSPYSITCHCGKCVECRNTRVSELLFRAERQHDYVVRHHGFAVFATLTFNTPSLNIYQYQDLDQNGNTVVKSVSTWNNALLRKWRNAVNMECMRKYKYRLYYLCTAERGDSNLYIDDYGHERRGTSRPHYHVILWFVPLQGVNPSFTPSVAFDIITRHWSHNPKKAKTLDISNRAKNEVACRFVADTEPIGIVYNEIISRTELEAIKYVVKYCFKDANETLNNLKDKHILSSSHKVPFVDACPRLHQSNGIGADFLNQVFNRDHYEDCAISLADYVTQNADGEKLRIPRYYIKRLAYITGITFEEVVFDFGKTFDGESYVYKYDQLDKLGNRIYRPLDICDSYESFIPIFGDPIYRHGDLITPPSISYELLACEYCKVPIVEETSHFRTISHKHQLRNKFGTIFADRNQENSAHDIYDCLRSWLNEPFLFEDSEVFQPSRIDLLKFPFLEGLPDERYFEFQKRCLRSDQTFYDASQYLSVLTFDEFRNLYNIHCHYPYYDDLILQSLEYTSPQLLSAYTFPLLNALRHFLEYREIESFCNSAVSRYNLKVEYENHGLHESAKKRPFLFRKRIL